MGDTLARIAAGFLSLFILAAIVVGRGGAAGVPSGSIPGNNLRMEFKNNSGHDVWVTVMGGITNGAMPGWFGTNGYLGFTSNALAAAPFLVSKSCTSANPLVVQLSPVPYSGRVSMSLDYPVLGFGIATSNAVVGGVTNVVVTGMQQPSPCGNPQVTPYENQWQYMEMSWQTDANGVGSTFIDATYIDAFHFPYTIKQNGTTNQSVGVAMSRSVAMAALKPQFTGMWTNCLLYSTNTSLAGKVCCVGNPGELLILTTSNWPSVFGQLSGFTKQVNKVWSGQLYNKSSAVTYVGVSNGFFLTNGLYESFSTPFTNTVVLAPNQVMVDISQIEPPPLQGNPYVYAMPCVLVGTFTNQTLTFNGNPATYPVVWPNPLNTWAAGSSSIAMPTNAFGDVIGCSGNLNPTDKSPQAIFAENIGAALNVGYWPTNGYFSPNFWTKAATKGVYYKKEPYNHYAKAVHSVLKNGMGYAFAFDDLAGKAGCYNAVTNGTTSDCGVTITIYDCTDWSSGVSAKQSGKSGGKKKGSHEFPADPGW